MIFFIIKCLGKELEIQHLFQWKRTSTLCRKDGWSDSTYSCSSLEQYHIVGEILQRQSTENLRSCYLAEYQSSVLLSRKFRLFWQQFNYRDAHGRVDSAQV